MQTSKPISTISYNTEDFLVNVLEDLLRTHIIDFYMYIQHIGEIDLFGEQEKDHIHLFVIPNKRINTADLDKFFIQPVSYYPRLSAIQEQTTLEDVKNSRENIKTPETNFYKRETKPLKCISWVVSKSDDWILYVLHDKNYLLSKFEERQIEYKYTDLRSSDSEDLRRKYRMAYQSSGYAKACNLYNYARSGGSINDLMRIGAIPVNQIEHYDTFFKVARQTNIKA